jgi:DNA polymerase III epsilon subunit-like protein
MVGVVGGTNEVILLCVADYLTGAILLNRLVSPTNIVAGWRTKIHGVTRSMLQAAISEGQALAGWKEARAELWRFIDSETILVGHALHHDLDVLRMIHHRVVDSAILARNAVGVRTRQWGLKDLCDGLLHVVFRKNEGEVHDCIEDVLATREVVLWCTKNQQELHAWANIKRLEEERKEEERKKAQQAKKDQIASMERPKDKNPYLNAGDEDNNFNSEESEKLHWSDIAEDLGWLHPDTGYDSRLD